jgi:hypothetical protein
MTDADMDTSVRPQYPSKSGYLKFGPKISAKITSKTLPAKWQKFFEVGEGANIIEAKMEMLCLKIGKEH